MKTGLHTDILVDPAARRLRDTLFDRPGVAMRDGFRGTLAVAGTRARLTVETSSRVQARLEVPARDAPSAEEALALGATLASNVRWVVGPEGLALRGDVALEGPEQIRAALEDLAAGLEAGRKPDAGSRGRHRDNDIDTDTDRVRATVEAALASAGFADDDLVALDGAWELRPRIAGRPAPVRVTLEPGGVLLSRTVLAGLPDVARPVVALEALRRHDRSAFARYAEHEGAVVAEARCPRALLSSTALVRGVRAVAALSAASPVLTVLARDGELARHYAALFPFPTPRSGACP